MKNRIISALGVVALTSGGLLATSAPAQALQCGVNNQTFFGNTSTYKNCVSHGEKVRFEYEPLSGKGGSTLSEDVCVGAGQTVSRTDSFKVKRLSGSC